MRRIQLVRRQVQLVDRRRPFERAVLDLGDLVVAQVSAGQRATLVKTHRPSRGRESGTYIFFRCESVLKTPVASIVVISLLLRRLEDTYGEMRLISTDFWNLFLSEISAENDLTVQWWRLGCAQGCGSVSDWNSPPR